MPSASIVSVLLSVHNGAEYLRAAVYSVLRQTLGAFELITVDDASTDATPEILESVNDSRLVVIRNHEQQGLARSLNRALECASSDYVARMDADDVAYPHWLERLLSELRRRPELAIVGSGVVQLDRQGQLGSLHLLPTGVELRWHALFSSPFLHNTVVLNRAVLERNALRYDPTFEETEDYDLWARLLAVAHGDNVSEPLVLHRIHAAQASVRRTDLQRALQREVSLREIAQIAPELPPDEGDLAWLVGSGQSVSAGDHTAAAQAFLSLLTRFEALWGRDRSVRARAARSLARASLTAAGGTRLSLLRQSYLLDAAWPARAAGSRARRRRRIRSTHRDARRLLTHLDRAVSPTTRVTAVFPEPTPYRAPLLDRVASSPDLELTVVYAADTVAGRTWHVQPDHHAVFLRGAGVPGAGRVLRHEYPITPGIASALGKSHPDVVAISGWSTFASQAAIAWSRLRGVPYVLVVESHDAGHRAGWRRKVKGTVVPPIVRGAAGVLVTGTLARQSMVERGAPAERVRVFANTIDVHAFAESAERLASRRDELREGLGAVSDDLVVLSVARLAPEKRLDMLVRAAAATGDSRILVVVAGSGPERSRLQALAREQGARLVLTGDRPWDTIVELYVVADVFALFSDHEPWGVVVNEAAACGLPLVLSDRVGAGYDLLRDAENGLVVPAGDVGAAAQALAGLAADPELRRRYGSRSHEIARDWGYDPSVANFLAAVREAVSDDAER